MGDDTVFAARHLPLARATSFESWSDLSGAPHLRAGFFTRKAPCAARHGATGSKLLSSRNGCGAANGSAFSASASPLSQGRLIGLLPIVHILGEPLEVTLALQKARGAECTLN
jgi:hypothetical protein